MYPLVLHKTLTPEKWSAFGRDQQLLMIGNELNRLLNRIKVNAPHAELRACMERGLELVDLTVGVNSGNFRKELLRWRELFGAFYLMEEEALRAASPEIKKHLKALLLLHPKSALCQI